VRKVRQNWQTSGEKSAKISVVVKTACYVSAKTFWAKEFFEDFAVDPAIIGKSPEKNRHSEGTNFLW